MVKFNKNIGSLYINMSLYNFDSSDPLKILTICNLSFFFFIYSSKEMRNINL